MKAFVYSKKTSKTVAIIKDVIRTEIYQNHILFVTKGGERIVFSTKEFKTTTYQN